MKGLLKVVSSAGGPGTAAALSCVYLYTRLQSPVPVGTESAEAAPQAAAPAQGVRALLGRLATSGMTRRLVRYRMRDGSRIVCRVMDSGGPLSVHVDGDYDLPGIDWAGVRTILDVGAHVGSFTIWAARRAPGARVLAVEPNPESFALLARNIGENGLRDRVTAVNAAVAGTPGAGMLELVDHSLGTRLARNGQGQVPVRIETVPNLLADAGMESVDLVKIDCEGMEYEVFEGLGPERLRSFGALACEYHPVAGRSVGAIEDSLKEAGFKVSRPDAPLAVLWATR